MKLKELRSVLNPSEEVSVIYRDPARGLNYKVLYNGLIKWCQNNSLLECRVVIVSTDELQKLIYIEIE